MNLEDLSIRDIEARIADAFATHGITRATLTALRSGDVPGHWRIEITLHGKTSSFSEPDGGEDVDR
ncbi:MAG: hypothetical protein N2690_00355 [Rhodocyclaceae bacterium]|nr:hypothetical protein [Rhodocyclaceae bacterium]